ncbi:MAG TPA: hypothetical protein VE782_08625 [Myxococcaceae bacterium]|nr:hypothetical protein [Myxococcaceae bacterium]
MRQRSAIVPLRGEVLVVFDPEVLAHRRTAPRRWMRDRKALLAELAEGRLLALDVGNVPFLEVRLVRTAAPGEPPVSALRVTSGSVYVGDAADLPSRGWGRRRWNLWDWFFAVFVCSLPVVGAWFLGFGARLLWVVGLTSALFVLLLIPISWAVFRSGWGFARRSGVPPNDRPDQVLALEVGAYAVSVRADRVGRRAVELHLRHSDDAVPSVTALPRVSFEE